MLRKTPPAHGVSGKDENDPNGKVWRALKRNDIGTEKSEEREHRKVWRTEKSDELKRGMQKKKGKEPAAGEEKFELHLY